MKTHTITAAILGLSLLSCNIPTEASSDLSAVGPGEITSQNLQDPNEIIERLNKTQPYSEAEFVESFPKSLNGLPLDGDLHFGKFNTIGQYGDNLLSLNVYDCAGKNSGMAGLFQTVYKMKMGDSDEEKHVNMERDGIKTTSTYHIKENESTIIFMYGQRWYVVLKGKDTNVDALWDGFDLSALDGFPKLN